MPTVYVLLCEKNRYYVGKTERHVKKRLEEHFSLNGSEWTRKYKPLRLVKKIPNADAFDEDKYTKLYMKKYGIDNVRGGAYTQLELPESTRSFLEREICSASDLCHRCHRPGHFVNQCYARTKADGSPVLDEDNEDEYSNSEYSDESEEECWCCEHCGKEFDTYSQASKHEKTCKYREKNTRACFRCGRSGHYADDCYAASH